MSDNSHLVPEVVKNIVQQANPNNKLTNASEKFNAEARLRAIIEACQAGLNVKKVIKK
jgi:hypothetical protein